MIKYLRHSDINKKLWDGTIQASPNGLVYATSWFLDIVSPGWDALVSENYEYLFPVTHRRKAGISYLFQPYFTQQLGVFSTKNIDDTITCEFLCSIPRTFKLIEIQLNSSNVINRCSDFKKIPKKTHWLMLDHDSDKLRAGYSENLKRNLKKSSGVLVQQEDSFDEIIKIFRENKGADISNLGDKEYKTFKVLMTEAARRGQLEVLTAKTQEGELIAGAIFLKSVHSWIFIFSATTFLGRSNGAMTAIIDSFIMQHSGENKHLDFEGSMDENLSRFYKSFGSKEVVYLQIRRNKLPPIIRWLK